MGSTRNGLRIFVRKVGNVLSNPKSADEVFNTVETVYKLTTGQIKTLLELGDFKSADVSEIKDLFLSDYYYTVANILLNHVAVEWMTHAEYRSLRRVFDGIFLEGNQSTSLTLLLQCIEKFRPGFRLNKCVSILEEFLRVCGLADIIWKECLVDKIPDQQFLWDELVNTIASLPDKTANKLQNQNSELFFPKSYIQRVATDLHTVLQKAHSSLKSSQDVSLEFVSKLVGKLCVTGYSEILWNCVLPHLAGHVREDYIWCRICERIVTGVPDRCLESVLSSLIQQIPWYGLMEKFLGDSVLKKQKIQYILCTKMLFLRHSEKVLILQNIIGYLGSSHTRKHLLIKVMKELLKVWGDSSALKHTSTEQHTYITQALFVCFGFLKEKDKEENRDECLRLLMPGMQCHISSSDPRIRKIGMIVGETITGVMDPKGQKLKFELERDEEVESLVALTTPPELDNSDLENLQSKLISMDIKKEPETSEEIQSEVSEADTELDSDDDLVPYDMSADVKKTTANNKPKYIRECMEGLICSDNPDRTEACLSAAEDLIRRKLDGLNEVAADFAKILLHLSDKYCTADFISLRFKSLVAIAVTEPIQVSNYLTKEFYERNYNLRQRMDMLEVLAAAAQELSQPTDVTKPTAPQEVNECKIVELSSDTESQSWRDIVQRRIESKTRRFGKDRSKPEPPGVANKFAPVAGHFFYPLMTKFDRKENTFDMMGEDSLVLARLVYTLGVIIYSAINTINVKHMGTRLLEFLWVLRFHGDQSVKQAVLFALSMVILSVPGSILLSELQQEILEAKRWLEDVVETDKQKESKQLALQCLVLLENVIKQEYTQGLVSSGP